MERVQIRGLPKGDYQVQCKTKEGWRKLVQTIIPDYPLNGASNLYYKFTQKGTWDFGIIKFDDTEEVTYDDWKEAIETHIRRVGDFKVGDLVYITKGYFDLKKGDVRALDGFDGMHWWIGSEQYAKVYLDIDEDFRHATKEEIPAQSNPPKPVSDLISDYTYSNIKGKKIAIHCPTQELWDKVIALIPNCRLNSNSGMLYGDRRCITPCVFNGSYSPIEYYKGEGYQIITAEEFIATNEKKKEPVTHVRKDGWKVGDKLPVEFLNLCTYYTDIHDIHSATNVEDDDGEKWIHDRVVKTVTSKGWAEVSGTYQGTYLSPKHEYPEYEHYENPKAIPASASVSASASDIMVTKDNAVVGLEVVRGRDWNYGDQDHVDGKQVVGVIVHETGYFPSNKNSGWVRVQWKRGRNDSYEIGDGLDNEDARYDLYVYQGSTEPVKSTWFDVKGNNPLQIPVGWKPGDSWRHRDIECGLSISVHPKDDDFNSYFVDYGENGTAWVTVKEINHAVATGVWIINPEQKSKEKEKEESQTIIISKQSNTKTKQDENIKESSIGISITEQCFITSGSYKFSKAAYIPGDEERITKGQRRQGSTVRG